MDDPGQGYHLLHDRAPGTVFSQTTAEADNDVLRLGAGARFMLDSGLNLTTRYVGKMAEQSRSHSLLLEAMYLF